MSEDNPISPSENQGEPQVFHVTRDLDGVKFTRREFIEAAGCTTAALTLAGCTLSGPRVVVVESGDELPTEVSDSDTSQAIDSTPTATKARPSATPQPSRTHTPTRTFTPTIPVVYGKAKVNGARIRTGPTTNFILVGSVVLGLEIKVIGRLADSSWFKVSVPLSDIPALQNAPISKKGVKFAEGWMRNDIIDVSADMIKFIPVVASPPTPTPPPNNPILPGNEGVRVEQKDLYGNSYTFTLPCGSDIPEDAVCVCNCVTVPTCSCVGDTCGCVGHTSCGCDTYASCPSNCSPNPNCMGVGDCSCYCVVYYYPN
jgi:hypothetical protein